jgi:hypothetical protein
MDSLSLFQSMQGNVNPMGAYAAGSKLANDMLAIQSQQAQQVFQNLYNSAQQAENRRQFEQTLAFRETQAADESARGWFNAETQRMAYDPNRGRTEGPPITAMQPQVTDLGRGLVSVRKATRDGFQDQIFQTGGRSGSTQQQSAFPPGISFSGDPTMPSANEVIPIPSGSPEPSGYSPNPIIDSESGMPVFNADGNYILGDAAPGETGGGDPETYGVPTGGMAPPAQSGLVPPRPIPPASVINTPAPQAQTSSIGITYQGLPLRSPPPADTIIQSGGLSQPIPPMGGNAGIDTQTSELLSEQPRGRTTAKSWLSQVPDYVRQGKDRLEAGETMRINNGGYTQEIFLQNGVPVSRSFENDGKPIGDGVFKPMVPSGTMDADVSSPSRLVEDIKLAQSLAGNNPMNFTLKQGGLTASWGNGSGGGSGAKDPRLTNTPGEFKDAIQDTDMRKRLGDLMFNIARPGGEQGDAAIRDELAIERNVDQGAVTPAQVAERRNQMRIRDAQTYDSIASNYFPNGATSWGGPAGVLKFAGFEMQTPKNVGGAGGESVAPVAVPVPKTPEEIALEAKAKEKADAILNGWNNVQENFGSRLLKDKKGNVRYTEEQLDGVASGIYRDPSRTGYRVDSMPEKSYTDRILVKLGLMSNTYPGVKRPGASIFTNLRPEEVALAWAKDRLMRKGILDSEGRFASKAAQEFNSGGTKIKSIEPIP